MRLYKHLRVDCRYGVSHTWLVDKQLSSSLLKHFVCRNWVKESPDIYIMNCHNEELNDSVYWILKRQFIDKGIPLTNACAEFARYHKCYSLLEDKPHQLITIALPNDYDIEILKKRISGLKYRYITNGKLCVENYSDCGSVNLHVHILKEKTYTKSKIIRDMARRFKVAPNFVDVATGRDPVLYNTRLDYVLGKKTDKKMSDVEKNLIWRKENKIKDIYYINATEA